MVNNVCKIFRSELMKKFCGKAKPSNLQCARNALSRQRKLNANADVSNTDPFNYLIEYSEALYNHLDLRFVPTPLQFCIREEPISMLPPGVKPSCMKLLKNFWSPELTQVEEKRENIEAAQWFAIRQAYFYEVQPDIENYIQLYYDTIFFYIQIRDGLLPPYEFCRKKFESVYGDEDESSERNYSEEEEDEEDEE